MLSFRAAMDWLIMLSRQTHWSFVVAVMVIYGINQGFGGAVNTVGTDYYMKEVQKLQTNQSEIYQQITRFPWIVKPVWGFLTDSVPFFGYHRRPYFVVAGIVGILSMIFLSVHEKLNIVLALASLTVGNVGGAIADVTVDACVAHHSGIHHTLAPDMQSLCILSSSIGSFIGFWCSGFFVHRIGPEGVYGLLTIPYLLVVLVGIMLDEPQLPSFAYRQVYKKLCEVSKLIWNTLNRQYVRKLCVYMFLSFALSLKIDKGLFSWATDQSKDGPSFSKELYGFVSSFGPVGYFFGVLLYQNRLKTRPFRTLLFWTQLLFGLSGMLDLVFVRRINLKLGIPDYVFGVIDESVSQFFLCLKWMPLYAISAQLCPHGIEGTFYACMMAIDNLGNGISAFLGGSILSFLNLTTPPFDNLWLAILIRNVMRITPLCFLYLVPDESELLGFSRIEARSMVENSESNIVVSSNSQVTELSVLA